MKKNLHVLVLACIATLLSNPATTLADDAVSPLDGRRPVVLAQATQKAKSAPGGQCREGQLRQCNSIGGQQRCACVPKAKSPRALKGKPQTLIHGSDTPGPR